MSDLVKTYLGRRKQVVVLVDPYSTGCLVGQEIAKRGYLLIRVWSAGLSDIMKQHTPVSCKDLRYYSTITVDDLPYDENADTTAVNKVMAAADAIAAAAEPYPIVAVLAGGDRGVDFSDALSEHFGLLTNGTDIPNRRDKKLQQELVRNAGMRAVRQAGGDQFNQVEAFLKTESYPIVVKPIESSGSDAVKLCSTFEEAKEHFEFIMRTPMVDGGANTGVLCQEFLRDKEYIVDHVSRDGVHKCMMLWVYDKRSANGAPFVYYGCIPIDSDSPEAAVLIPYVRGVLDAMGVKHGASHAEVMLTETGPCLVEMNCRANGGDGIWRPLVRALTGGYTQVEATADAFLDKERFLQYHDKPPSPEAAGCEIELVSYQRGVVKATPGYFMIAQLPSFVHLESIIKKGSTVEYTVDLDTCVGTVCLMHPNPDVVEKDISFIRYMEEMNGIFEFEPVLENLKRPLAEAVAQKSVYSTKRSHVRVFSSIGQTGLLRHASMHRKQLQDILNQGWEKDEDNGKKVVFMVDPYSTGACIAQDVMKRGYNVIALWTKGFPEEMKVHVPFVCGNLIYFDEVEEGETLDETIQLVKRAARHLSIAACIVGDDLGVNLCDALSEQLNLRSNGTNIRTTDKKLQQELVDKAGLHSIRQAGGSDFADIAMFLKTHPFPIVLKPAKTAGSDGVKLCHTFHDVKSHFEVLKKSQVVTALEEAPTIVAQEFLRGNEFVVDHVSRDGQHKTLMIWKIDKRNANAYSNVHFGVIPEPSDSPDAFLLIPYVRAVLDAVGVKNGPSHTEVIMTASGPCFIKVSCAAHGGDGNWISLSKALTGGFSQVEATTDAYLDEEAFLQIPDVPCSPLKAAGLEILLVSFSRGVVQSTPGFDTIKQLPSFVYLETGIKEGSEVDYTVDLFTSVGSAILMHHDPDVVERDLATIREMEEANELFEYDLEAGILKSHTSKLTIGTEFTISADRPEIFF